MILAWEQVDAELPKLALGSEIKVKLAVYNALEDIRGKKIVGLNYVSPSDVGGELHEKVTARILVQTSSLSIVPGSQR